MRFGGCVASRLIVALFVDPRGVYAGVDDVDIWGMERDARQYCGPYPVVAHPPCARWCRLAGLVQARWGYKIGDDDGCFASALASVRKHGGVLEHPAYTKAWPAYGLRKPHRLGGWVPADDYGGYTCHVEQGQYGHVAKKATWLYANKTKLPELLWGATPDSQITHLVSWCGNHVKATEKRPRVGKRAAAATPPAFRDVLIAMARSVRQGEP